MKIEGVGDITFKIWLKAVRDCTRIYKWSLPIELFKGMIIVVRYLMLYNPVLFMKVVKGWIYIGFGIYIKTIY